MEEALEEKYFAGVDQEQPMPLSEGGFALLNSVMSDGAPHFSVSALSFDSKEELLWMGNSGGHLTSYYGPAMEKYTSFQVHPRNDVRQILTMDAGVLALTKTNLKCNSRQGLGIFNFTSPSLIDLQCMHLYTPSGDAAPTSIVIGGCQPRLIMLDLYELKEIRRVELSEPNCLVSRGTEKFLFTGDTNGKIAMRSWESLETIQLLEAHGGPISDFDICGTKLITCGFSARSMGGLNCDRFLMMYDLRMLRAMAPITVSIDPFFLRFLPTFSDNRLLVASQVGNFQVFDIGASPGSPFFYHVDTQGTALLSVDIAPSKQCVAFGDGAGLIHVFSDRATPVFNECSRPTEFVDPPMPLPPIPFTDQMTPLSLIPMPLHWPSGRLLSDWPPTLTKRTYRIPQPIDPEVLQNMKMVNFIGHAPRLASKKFSNVVPYDLKAKTTDLTARSRSPQVGRGAKFRHGSDPLVGGPDDANSAVPPSYRKIIVKYGRDEPDYKAYNQTSFSALEPISSNSYMNSLLQVFFHTEPLRHAVWSHICQVEFCLACEMSFLFHMLYSAGARQTCSASNFLRAFRTMPEASALSLVLTDTGAEASAQKTTDLGMLIQRVNLFLLRQVHSELEQAAAARMRGDDFGSEVGSPSKEEERETEKEETKEEPETPSPKERSETPGTPGTPGSEKSAAKVADSIIERLFSSSIFYITRCKCGNETSRDDKSMVLTLTSVTPVGDQKGTLPATATAFASALEKSFSLEQTTQTWCEKCSKFQPSLQARRTRGLPEVLIVNCPVEAEKTKGPLMVQQKVVTSAIPTGASEKPCRYGINCIRADCFYFHPERSPSPSLVLAERQAKAAIAQSSEAKRNIPCKLPLHLDEKGIVTVKLADEDGSKGTDGSDALYELYAVVELIKEANEQHLVASIRSGDEWTLFNDYYVTKISAEDATTFDVSWKVPCLLYFAKADYNSRYEKEGTYMDVYMRAMGVMKQICK